MLHSSCLFFCKFETKLRHADSDLKIRSMYSQDRSKRKTGNKPYSWFPISHVIQCNKNTKNEIIQETIREQYPQSLIMFLCCHSVEEACTANPATLLGTPSSVYSL